MTNYIVVFLAFIGLLFLVSVFLSFFVPRSEIYFPDLIERYIYKIFGRKTNGDWIRGMTDEELARFLSEEENLVCILCRDESFDCCRCFKDQREKVYMQWLLKPACDPWEAYDEEVCNE